MSTADVAEKGAEAPVLVERRGRLGLLTLNRPRAMNALNHEMVLVITTTLRDWLADPQVEAVLVRGAGDRGLCAGGDIVSIHRDAVTGGRGTETFWFDEYHLNALIASYPKPYIALMDGIVLGGGVGVSAHGSHRVVTERTRIGMPETGIGFVPDVGGTWLLSRAPGELGTYMAMTASLVDAGDAIELGLADHFVVSEHLAVLTELLEVMPVSDALAEVVQPPPASQLDKRRGWIDEAFAADDVAGVLGALLHHEEPDARAAGAAVSVKSPTALAVTLRALREARGMGTLEQALAQELRIATRMLGSHDFPEGIRAQVIDKDRSPRWSPPTIADLDPAEIQAYFTTTTPPSKENS